MDQSARSIARQNITRIIASILALMLVVVAVIYMLREVRLDDVRHALEHVTAFDVLATMGLLGASQVLRAIRWTRMLNWERRPPIKHSWHALLSGQMINWLSPVRIGEVWRVWEVSRPKPHVASPSLFWAGTTVLIEKSLDSLMLAIITLALLFAPLKIDLPLPMVRLMASGFGIALLITVVLAMRPDRWHQRFEKRFPQLAALNLSPDTDMERTRVAAMRDPRRWLELLGTSALIWGIAILTNLILARSMGIRAGLGAHLLFIVVLQTGMAVGMVPANVGVFPLAASLVFEASGYDRALVFAYSSLLYVLVYSVNVLLWLALSASVIIANRLHVRR
jgi:uncharacterized membrane protein YbhN (UPF0104 family)